MLLTFNMKETTIMFTPEEQRENLRKLGEYLHTGKTRMKFDMNIYCRTDNINLRPDKHECGTVGCALGHAPEATGIKGLPDENWYQYSKRVFGIIDPYVLDPDNAASCSYQPMWEWCFAGEWADVDNTPEGAGRRILYYLDHGVPKDWLEQMTGDIPLCY